MRKQSADLVVVETIQRVNAHPLIHFDLIRGLAVGFVIAYPLFTYVSKRGTHWDKHG